MTVPKNPILCNFYEIAVKINVSTFAAGKLKIMNKKTLCCIAMGLLAVGNAMAQSQRRMTIDELFDLVEKGSSVLKQHVSEQDVALHGVEEAKSRRLPDINASLSASYNGNVLMTDRDFSDAKGISQPHFGNSFSL